MFAAILGGVQVRAGEGGWKENRLWRSIPSWISLEYFESCASPAANTMLSCIVVLSCILPASCSDILFVLVARQSRAAAEAGGLIRRHSIWPKSIWARVRTASRTSGAQVPMPVPFAISTAAPRRASATAASVWSSRPIAAVSRCGWLCRKGSPSA